MSENLFRIALNRLARSFGSIIAVNPVTGLASLATSEPEAQGVSSGS